MKFALPLFAPMFRCFRSLVWLMASIGLCWACPSYAHDVPTCQDSPFHRSLLSAAGLCGPENPRSKRKKKPRTFAIGFTLGVGVALGKVSGAYGRPIETIGVIPTLPTLDFRWFVSSHGSLELRFFVGNAIAELIAGAWDGRFFFPNKAGIQYTHEFGEKSVRFLLSIEGQVHFSLLPTQTSDIGYILAFRIAPSLGIATINHKHNFEHQFRIRPFFEVGHVDTSVFFFIKGLLLGGGVLAELGFLFF